MGRTVRNGIPNNSSASDSKGHYHHNLRKQNRIHNNELTRNEKTWDEACSTMAARSRRDNWEGHRHEPFKNPKFKRMFNEGKLTILDAGPEDYNEISVSFYISNWCKPSPSCQTPIETFEKKSRKQAFNTVVNLNQKCDDTYHPLRVPNTPNDNNTLKPLVSAKKQLVRRGKIGQFRGWHQ